MLWTLFVDAVDKLVYWTWVIPDCESGHLCWICVSCFWTALWMTEEAEPTSVPNMLQYPCLSFSSGLHDSFPNVLDIKPGKKTNKKKTQSQSSISYCDYGATIATDLHHRVDKVHFEFCMFYSREASWAFPLHLYSFYTICEPDRQTTILLVFLWTFIFFREVNL